MTPDQITLLAHQVILGLLILLLATASAWAYITEPKAAGPDLCTLPSHDASGFRLDTVIWGHIDGGLPDPHQVQPPCCPAVRVLSVPNQPDPQADQPHAAPLKTEGHQCAPNPPAPPSGAERISPAPQDDQAAHFQSLPAPLL